jgi:hypothetical protein
MLVWNSFKKYSILYFMSNLDQNSPPKINIEEFYNILDRFNWTKSAKQRLAKKRPAQKKLAKKKYI